MFRNLTRKISSYAGRGRPPVRLELQQLEGRDLLSGTPLVSTLPMVGLGGSISSSNNGTNAISPITITNPGDQSNSEGDTVALPIQATDANGGTLTYSVTGLPAGLAIDPNTGLISGTVATGSSAYQVFSPTITASDGSASDQLTFTWIVNDPITITNPGDQTNNEGDTVALQIQASDIDSSPLIYTVTGLPDGLAIDPNTGLISGTIAPGSSANGPFSPTVTASDGVASNQLTFNWFVNGPITFTDPGYQSNNEGDTVALQIQASDINGGPLTYSATSLPAGLAIDPNTGLISGTIATGSSAFQVFSSTITASDGVNSSQLTLWWFVNGSPLVYGGAPTGSPAPPRAWALQGTGVRCPTRATASFLETQAWAWG